MIAADLTRAVGAGRSPLLLTGRTEHLQYFAAKLDTAVKHVFILKGGIGKTRGGGWVGEGSVFERNMMHISFNTKNF
jgi:hypothetical protein